MSDRVIKVDGLYRHFKGFKAHVLAVAKHTETGEILVVYECFGKSSESDGIFARPAEMFLSEVDREKYPEATQKYRFELID